VGYRLTQLLALIVLGTLSSPATGSAAGDPVRGKREFLRCAICHSAEPNVHKVGPSLATIYGRTAGMVESFTAYSEALSGAGIVWTEETLDAWLKDPAGFIPGNSMKASGIKDAVVRRDLIAYLKELAGQNAAETTGSFQQ
jgi:cytochrome c